jgi:DNA-directed RNA polymerase specialized sigma24 family protein
MAAVQSSFARPFTAPLTNSTWCLLLLEYLDDLATLAWYLVADGRLVEETFSRTLAQLDTIPFDASVPLLAYSQAREVLISQALDVLTDSHKADEENRIVQAGCGELPDLPRLAFMLRFIIRSPENEVANFLDVTPLQVRQLVKRAVDHLSTSGPLSVPVNWHKA